MTKPTTLSEKPKPVRLVQEKNINNAAFKMVHDGLKCSDPTHVVHYDEREDCWACGVCGKVTGFGSGGKCLAERCCPPRTCIMADCEELAFGSSGICAGCQRKIEIENFARAVAKAKEVKKYGDMLCDYDNPEKMYPDIDDYLDDLDERLFELTPGRSILVSPVLFLAKEDEPSSGELIEVLVDRICAETDDEDGTRREYLLNTAGEDSGLAGELESWLEMQPTWYVPAYEEYIDIREDVRAKTAEINEDRDEDKKYVEGVHWSFVEIGKTEETKKADLAKATKED